jgi:hypothetical protein
MALSLATVVPVTAVRAEARLLPSGMELCTDRTADTRLLAFTGGGNPRHVVTTA